MIFLLIIAFIGMALFEVPGLISRKWWWELAVFSILLLFSFVLCLMQIIGAELPNLTKEITYLVRLIL